MAVIREIETDGLGNQGTKARILTGLGDRSQDEAVNGLAQERTTLAWNVGV